MNRSTNRSARRRPSREPRPEPLRSIAARILNRYETSSKLLDEIIAVEFAQRDDLEGGRRHRARLVVNEVVRHKATLDQLLKVYSTRDPRDMENHVRTVLRLALAEWFFVPPRDAEATGEQPRERDEHDIGAGIDADADATTTDDDLPVEQEARERERGRGRDRERDDVRSRRRSRFRRDSRRYESERGDDGAEGERWGRDNGYGRGTASPVARGPIAAAAVNLVGLGRPSRGFVNGVLRAIDRESRFLPDERLTADDTPRDRLAAPNGMGVYQFRHTLFADPEKKPATWLAQSQSLPRWLTERFIARYGLRGAIEVAMASNATPALSVRVNTREISPDELRREMAAAGIHAHETPLPEVLRIEPHVPLTTTPFFEEGLIYLQDLTAARTTHAVDLVPGMRILDACAAPGGKITHACERLDGKGSFFALDVSRRRLRLLQENIDRLGHSEIQAIHGDLRDFAYQAGAKFDVIFVDAPCTNTGVLARRVDARWRVNEALQSDLIKLQLELLQAARSLLSPAGRLVYSTCTLEPEENRGVVVQTDLKLGHDALWLPEAGICDGGYHAVLRLPE